jgi:hypothetical protein
VNEREYGTRRSGQGTQWPVVAATGSDRVAARSSRRFRLVATRQGTEPTSPAAFVFFLIASPRPFPRPPLRAPTWAALAWPGRGGARARFLPSYLRLAPRVGGDGRRRPCPPVPGPTAAVRDGAASLSPPGPGCVWSWASRARRRRWRAVARARGR